MGQREKGCLHAARTDRFVEEWLALVIPRLWHHCSRRRDSLSQSLLSVCPSLLSLQASLTVPCMQWTGGAVQVQPLLMDLPGQAEGSGIQVTSAWESTSSPEASSCVTHVRGPWGKERRKPLVTQKGSG